jgi:hypothetical protein
MSADAHFAIGGLMHEAALQADEDPDRLSFAYGPRCPTAHAPLRCYSPSARKAFHEIVLQEDSAGACQFQSQPDQSRWHEAQDEQL